MRANRMPQGHLLASGLSPSRCRPTPGRYVQAAPRTEATPGRCVPQAEQRLAANQGAPEIPGRKHTDTGLTG